MASGSPGKNPLSRASGALHQCSVLNWPPLVPTLQACWLVYCFFQAAQAGWWEPKGRPEIGSQRRLWGECGPVWHEARAHASFQVVYTTARIGTRSVVSLVCGRLPALLSKAPLVCVFMGFCRRPPVPLPTHEPQEPALVLRQGVDIAWTDGPGRHSSNPIVGVGLVM
eukprot:6483193-Amphidinium_carterae.3